MLEDIIPVIVFIALFAIFFSVIYRFASADQERRNACRELVSPYQHKLMDKKCYKLSENGTDWIFVPNLSLEE